MAPGWRGSLEERHERASLARHGVGDAREREQRGCEVDRLHHLRRRGACARDLRVADDQRDARGLLVREAPLLVEPMLPIEVAVVAREHDDRVVELAELLERPHQPAEALVHAQEHLLAGTDVGIAGARGGTERRQPGNPTEQGGLPHGRLEGVRAPRHDDIRVPATIARGGDEPRGLRRERGDAAVVTLHDVRVQRLVREEEQERLLPRLLHEVDGEVGEHVGDVALHLLPLPVDVELRVDRLALALHRHPAGPAGPRGVIVPHVPLAHERRPVAGSGEWDREGRQAMARRVARGVVGDAVGVGVLAGEDARPARAAERRGGEGVEEAHALTCEAVDVRRLGEGVPGDADLVPAEVIDEDEDDVRPPLDGFRRCACHRRAQRQEQQSSHRIL